MIFFFMWRSTILPFRIRAHAILRRRFHEFQKYRKEFAIYVVDSFFPPAIVHVPSFRPWLISPIFPRICMDKFAFPAAY